MTFLLDGICPGGSVENLTGVVRPIGGGCQSPSGIAFRFNLTVQATIFRDLCAQCADELNIEPRCNIPLDFQSHPSIKARSWCQNNTVHPGFPRLLKCCPETAADDAGIVAGHREYFVTSTSYLGHGLSLPTGTSG